MSNELPLVVRWDTFPRDLTDPMRRFRTSKWNYFLKDQEAQLLAGFWEAEDGCEIVGEMVGFGHVDELMLVLEGQLDVSAEGEPQQVAGPGDLVACMHYRQARVVVKGHARVFFFVYHIDPEATERKMRETG